MRDSLIYNDETKLKDLTVGELKDIITECLYKVTVYNKPTLECLGKDIVMNRVLDTQEPYC